MSDAKGRHSTKTRMCFFDKDDLYKMVNDEKIFSSFNLLERERRVIFARVVNKIRYKHLAPLLSITISRTHQLYQQGIQKMKSQIMERLGQ